MAGSVWRRDAALVRTAGFGGLEEREEPGIAFALNALLHTENNPARFVISGDIRVFPQFFRNGKVPQTGSPILVITTDDPVRRTCPGRRTSRPEPAFRAPMQGEEEAGMSRGWYRRDDPCKPVSP